MSETEDAAAVAAMIADLKQQLELSHNHEEYLQEAYSDAVRSMLAAEDVGWRLLGGTEQDGFSISQLHDVTRQLREWTKTNPLLTRGIEIRTSYLFSAGFEIAPRDGGDVKPQARAILDDPVNQDVLFSMTALNTNEMSRYTDGNFFVVYNEVTKQFRRIPFHEITDARLDPDNNEQVWYYEHTYTRKTLPANSDIPKEEKVIEWFHTDTYKRPTAGYDKFIKGKPVVPNAVIIDHRVNRSTGDVWGTPDCFAAAPWALAYSAYLRDGTKLLSALAEFAWKISPKNKQAGTDVGAKMAANKEKGKTAVTDAEMTALPRNNAVDLNTGRPIAAQVASALGVSVVLLLSDPGQSGAYGTAQTLTDPSIKTMTFRQEENTVFLLRCLRAAKLDKLEVVWGKMATDADYREMETLAMLLGTGLFHADELRPLMAKLAKVKLLHDEAPEGYLIPNNEESLALKSIDMDSKGPQTDGSNSQVNGQGRSNNKVATGRTGSNDLKKADAKAK